MRINFNTYSINTQQPQNTSFKRHIGQIADISTKVPCYCNTIFFRDDIVWDKFAKFLYEKYKNVPKVTFINHTCSGGEEPYSVVMKLMTDLGKDAEKFFPIIARDLSRENIERAKTGNIIGKYDEIAMINSMTAPITDTLVKYTALPYEQYLIQPKLIVKDKIDFSVGNVLDDVKHIPERNTVLFCRNVWQYLDGKERDHLMSEISKKFKDDSSILFTGQADIDNSNITYLLCKYNFVNAGFPNAYVKSDVPDPIAKYLNFANEVYPH